MTTFDDLASVLPKNARTGISIVIGLTGGHWYRSITTITNSNNGQGNRIVYGIPTNRQSGIRNETGCEAHSDTLQINSGDVVVFDFFATWCPPCKAISPDFERLAGQNTSVKFYKVNVDNQEQVSEEVSIRAVSAHR